MMGAAYCLAGCAIAGPGDHPPAPQPHIQELLQTFGPSGAERATVKMRDALLSILKEKGAAGFKATLQEANAACSASGERHQCRTAATVLTANGLVFITKFYKKTWEATISYVQRGNSISDVQVSVVQTSVIIPYYER
jgi:hypothetical protein